MLAASDTDGTLELCAKDELEGSEWGRGFASRFPVKMRFRGLLRVPARSKELCLSPPCCRDMLPPGDRDRRRPAILAATASSSSRSAHPSAPALQAARGAAPCLERFVRILLGRARLGAVPERVAGWSKLAACAVAPCRRLPAQPRTADFGTRGTRESSASWRRNNSSVEGLNGA